MKLDPSGNMNLNEKWCFALLNVIQKKYVQEMFKIRTALLFLDNIIFIFRFGSNFCNKKYIKPVIEKYPVQHEYDKAVPATVYQKLNANGQVQHGIAVMYHQDVHNHERYSNDVWLVVGLQLFATMWCPFAVHIVFLLHWLVEHSAPKKACQYLTWLIVWSYLKCCWNC